MTTKAAEPRPPTPGRGKISPALAKSPVSNKICHDEFYLDRWSHFKLLYLMVHYNLLLLRNVETLHGKITE